MPEVSFRSCLSVLAFFALSGCSSENASDVSNGPPDAAASAGSLGNPSAGSSGLADSAAGLGGSAIVAGGTAGTGDGGGTIAGGSSLGGSSATGGSSAGGSTQAGAAGSAGAGAGGGSAGSAGGSVPLDPSLLSHCTGTSPIVCTLDAPNGNYDVTAELGDATSAATSQLSAETRHYSGPAQTTAAGSYALQSFTVNVRQEQHDGGQSAPGNVLDLTISGAAPKLHGIGFRAAPSSVTIFIASDSTVCDWVATNSSALAPDETGWGQELSMYLKPGIAVANYADSGETAGSFYSKFFPAARAAMKAGDYLFIQFGHNDQKSATDVTNYKANLTKYLTDARAKNVTPVIFTPVSRSGGSAADPGFAGLDQQARDLAAQQNVALVDLTALSRTYYTTVPDKSALFIGGTHFHEAGAIAVAGVVATALKASDLPLKDFVK